MVYGISNWKEIVDLKNNNYFLRLFLEILMAFVCCRIRAIIWYKHEMKAFYSDEAILVFVSCSNFSYDEVWISSSSLNSVFVCVKNFLDNMNMSLWLRLTISWLYMTRWNRSSLYETFSVSSLLPFSLSKCNFLLKCDNLKHINTISVKAISILQ